MNASDPQARDANCAATQKVCGACGEIFACGAPLGDCWCEDLKLANGALSDLRARYADCLCPRCLAAAGAAAGESSK